MTQLVQRALAEIDKLPPLEQDAIAALILDELADERAWAGSFAATTDEQWKRMADEAHREIAAGEAVPLDDVFPQRA
ncbi:MAG: hypothetical protein AAB353_02895 [Candidatus Hydrogenedentota bacterium]